MCGWVEDLWEWWRGVNGQQEQLRVQHEHNICNNKVDGTSEEAVKVNAGGDEDSWFLRNGLVLAELSP